MERDRLQKLAQDALQNLPPERNTDKQFIQSNVLSLKESQWMKMNVDAFNELENKIRGCMEESKQ